MALAPRRIRPPCAIPPPTPVPRNDAEDGRHAHGGTVGCFRQSKAVGVVGQANWSPERALEILLQRATNQPSGVGVLDQSGNRRDRPRYTDPDRRRFTDPPLDHFDQSGDRFYRGAIIARRRPDAPTDAHRAEVIDGRRFDLRAAKIDADAESGCHRLCTFIGARQEGGYGLLSSILYNPRA